MMTQLSARTMTQKVMDNEMKRSYLKIQNSKNKTHVNRCSELIIHFYIHTHSHGYKIQTATVNTHNYSKLFYIWFFLIF